MPLSDEALMEQFQAGDEQAFDILVERYEKPLFNFIYQFVRDYHLAEDLYQETFLRLYRAADRYDPSQKFSTWLYSIATHLCINAIKKRERERLYLEAEQVSTLEEVNAMKGGETEALSDPAGSAEQREMYRALQKALEALSADHRLVIVMRHYQGLNYKEISEILGCSLGTVKSRLHYALGQLQSTLRREG